MAVYLSCRYVFPTTHYVVTMLSLCLVFTITLLYAVINFPFLNAIEQMAVRYLYGAVWCSMVQYGTCFNISLFMK